MHDVILPLLLLLTGAFLSALLGRIRPALSYPVGVLALVLAVFYSLSTLFGVLHSGPVTYLLGGWAPPWGIAFEVDELSAAMMVLISLSSLIAFVTFRDEILANTAEKTAAFVTLSMLTVAGHIGIVATGDLFNLYVLIEVSALSGYALLGFGARRTLLSSLNYLCIGSVGASFYLLGVGYLYMVTGSLNIADIYTLFQTSELSMSLRAAVAVIMLGLWVKMALFPFHGWLPGAYAYGSTAASALLAPLTTKVMIYVMVRLLLDVFPADSLIPSAIPNIAVPLATAAILVGSLMAFRQKNQRKMICYILVAEIGYMVGGIFIGNRAAMTGAVLHIFADSLMTLTIFLAMGNIISRQGSSDMTKMKGLFKTMPFTMACFVLGAMSMIGVPPFFGFFSKWQLLTGAMQAGHYVFMVGLILSSLVNVVLFFRLFETAFFEKPDEPEAATTCQCERWYRVMPLAVAASLLVLAGLSSGLIIDKIIARIIPITII